MKTADKEVFLLTERFHPDTTSASGQYMTDIAIGLQERGLDVTVLTRSITGVEDTETQERIKQAGVTVKRVPIPDLEQSSFARRLFNWFTYMLVAIPLLLIGRVQTERYVVFVSYPTVMPPLVWAVCKIRGWEFMYIIHDYHPEAAVELGYIERGGLIHRIWERLNQHLLVDATDIVVLGPKMRERVVESVSDRFGADFDEATVSVIHNWADGEFIQPQSKADNQFSEQHGLVEQFSLVYSGNIGKFHDLETVVGAASEFDPEELQILIIGEGDNKAHVSNLAAETGVLGEQVDLLPYQPWETVPDSLTAGDVSIVAVNPEFEGLCVSSKLYSALATGQPVLVIAGESDDESQLVRQFDAGIQATPGKTEEIVDAIERWRNDPKLRRRQGQNARDAFEANFTREHSIDEYYALIAD